MHAIDERIQTKLSTLYGEAAMPAIFERLQAIIASAQSTPRELPSADHILPLTEQDMILITYGDQVKQPDEAPLTTLGRFLNQTIQGLINTVHILPFYPYTSDDGFSVVDYYAINPELGTWEDVRALGRDFKLMFDAVFNHVSVQNAWFQSFLRGEAPYTDYFITADPQTDLSQVRRPRTLPLLTPFDTQEGTRHVWTTFSADQVDLNAASPDVLLELIRALLFYVEQGADLIRLDAIAYLWKTIGTSCIHLEQTHLVIQLMRDVLDLVAPQVVLITETNVPHDENISYFGDGFNEAQMVYQFSLPPLILHTFRTGDASDLARWATGLQRVSDRTTFFNFTASHDGIGVQPARGILSDSEINALVQLAEAQGGHVSYKTNSDGSSSPYELNITYFDAINPPELTKRAPETAVKRFICSQAIMLAFIGVPGIYFHSLFGSRNHHAGVRETGRYRSINREKVAADDLLTALERPSSVPARVFNEYKRLLSIRAGSRAFHPLGDQTVLDVGARVFALRRTSPDGAHQVIALHNVTAQPQRVTLTAGECGWRDLIGGSTYLAASMLELELSPYQVVWLEQV